MDERSIIGVHCYYLKFSDELHCLFHLKCAIIALYNLDLKKREINDILFNLDKFSDPRNFGTFVKICQFVEEKYSFSKTLLIKQQFRQLDTFNRGYITNVEFSQNFSLIAPKLSKSISADVFTSVDSHKIGKVSYNQFEDVLITDR